MQGFDGPVLEEVTLTEDGGVIKRIYGYGDEADPKPEEGQKVHACYEGRLESTGKVFDKSVDPENAFEFEIGVGQVIKGWDIGMASMRIGEKAELVLKPEYAYGESGAGADIPPNATLIFKVEIH
jgi:FKBP-type peptidyl-prolyl cis-trans isomerase